MTAKTKTLTGRKDDLVERRDVARRNFHVAIKGIANSLDWNLSKGKFGQGQKAFQQVRFMLDDRVSRFTLTVERLSDLEDQRTLFTESALFIALAMVAAHQSGRTQVASQMWGIISKQQKQKTANARSAALAKGRPQKDAKANITIECANAHLAQIQLKPKSRNALAVAIRPDIERKCKQSGIKLPSVSSITGYLKDAGLGS